MSTVSRSRLAGVVTEHRIVTTEEELQNSRKLLSWYCPFCVESFLMYFLISESRWPSSAQTVCSNFGISPAKFWSVRFSLTLVAPSYLSTTVTEWNGADEALALVQVYIYMSDRLKLGAWNGSRRKNKIHKHISANFTSTFKRLGGFKIKPEPDMEEIHAIVHVPQRGLFWVSGTKVTPGLQTRNKLWENYRRPRAVFIVTFPGSCNSRIVKNALPKSGPMGYPKIHHRFWRCCRPGPLKRIL